MPLSAADLQGRSPRQCWAAPAWRPCSSIRIRSIRRISAARNSTARRPKSCARPGSPRACCGRRRRTANPGSPAAATWWRNGQATNTAFSTRPWSTPSVVLFRPACRRSSPRQRRSRPATNGKPSPCRTARKFPHGWSCLANGLNIGLRHSLGLTRKLLSECHSISIGFDVKPAGRQAFEFPALTYYAERTEDQTALLTLFPIGATMRANLFVYRDMHDPWLRAMRTKPEETLHALMPGLRKLTGDFEIDGAVKIRPVDLVITHGHRQAGIVLVGDAFSTSCPAAGTGARKALNDVERLCNVHIPRWLATPGMAADKIAAFYDDPVKVACDDYSLAKAYNLRSFSLDTGLRWQIKRRLKFLGQYGFGMLRRLTQDAPPVTSGEQVVPAAANGRPYAQNSPSV